MKRKLSFCLYLAVGCFLARTACADVVYSTFGPNDSFDQSSGVNSTWTLVPLDPSASFAVANAAGFQVGAGSYTLSSVSLAIGYGQGTNNLAIRLVADNGGKPTGPILETIVSHPTGITGFAQVVTYPSSLDPVLTGGKTYWLVVEPADLNLADASNNGWFNWWTGANLPTGAEAVHNFNFFTQDWSAWQVGSNDLLPAFRIEGFAVPEPNASALALVGAALFAFRLGRRRLP